MNLGLQGAAGSMPPPPLWGRVREGVSHKDSARGYPLSNSPPQGPQGGREPTARVVRVPQKRCEPHVSIFTYSKSPGLLSMPTLGGEIHGANWPISVTGVISEAMKSPSSAEGSHSPFRLLQVASSISTPSGVAWISLNSPIWRWNATFGSVSLKS